MLQKNLKRSLIISKNGVIKMVVCCECDNDFPFKEIIWVEGDKPFCEDCFDESDVEECSYCEQFRFPENLLEYCGDNVKYKGKHMCIGCIEECDDDV